MIPLTRNETLVRLFSTGILALLVSCATQPPVRTLRIATFNVAMGLGQAGELGANLRSGSDPRLVKLADIIQRVRPDVLLLNEFDFDPGTDAAALLNEKYLQHTQSQAAPISYPWSYAAPVNTGVDSGLDLDLNGRTGDPADAWGFGVFPGQYGMLVLSRFPLEKDTARTFRTLLWRDLPDAGRPVFPDGTEFYPDEVWEQLRLSSKSHWDIPISADGDTLHLLVSHPTPPVFDGPEDRNGRRNAAEIRFWASYINPEGSDFIVDDRGNSGGLERHARFVIAGDLNSDPADGDSSQAPILALLDHPAINSQCTPASSGGAQAATDQAGANLRHKGNPAFDTSDFSDEAVGNLRLDYVLPSAHLEAVACGVFWPAPGEDGAGLETVSDHRLTWIEVKF